MTVEVIKRSGERGPFDTKKLLNSITRAAIDAGLQVEKKKHMIVGVAQRAIEMAEHKKQIETSVLRDSILDELEQTESKVAAAWEDYDRKHKALQK